MCSRQQRGQIHYTCWNHKEYFESSCEENGFFQNKRTKLRKKAPSASDLIAPRRQPKNTGFESQITCIQILALKPQVI